AADAAARRRPRRPAGADLRPLGRRAGAPWGPRFRRGPGLALPGRRRRRRGRRLGRGPCSYQCKGCPVTPLTRPVNWHLRAGSTGAGPETVRVTPEQAGWGYAGLRVVELAAGGSYNLATGDDEVVVLPLAGSCVVEAPFGHAELAGRPSVFEATTDYAYLPRDSPARLTSAGGGRFALASARARRRLPFRHLRADEAPVGA